MPCHDQTEALYGQPCWDCSECKNKTCLPQKTKLTVSDNDFELLSILFLGTMGLLYGIGVGYYELLHLKVMYTPSHWALLLLVGTLALLGLRSFTQKR